MPGVGSGPCASSGRAWQLGAARHSPGEEAAPLGGPSLEYLSSTGARGGERAACSVADSAACGREQVEEASRLRRDDEEQRELEERDRCRAGCTHYGCSRTRRGSCTYYGCAHYGCAHYGCARYVCTHYGCAHCLTVITMAALAVVAAISLLKRLLLLWLYSLCALWQYSFWLLSLWLY